MFNALNHVNFNNPNNHHHHHHHNNNNNNNNSLLFGRITGAGGMRSMQMGLRLQF